MNRAVHQTRPPLRIVDPEGPLMLCAPQVQQAPALVEALDESLDALRRFMPWAHLPQTVDVQYARLTEVVGAYWRGDDYNLHIYDPRAPQRALGGVGLHRRTMNRQALEMGYWVRSGDAGRGVCTRAARMVLVLAIELFGCQRVQCGYDVGNLASARVAAKVGFEIEGDLRNFGPAGDDAMRANGWAGVGTNRMTALGPERARSQPWYPGLRDRLEVYDWLGRRVELETEAATV